MFFAKNVPERSLGDHLFMNVPEPEPAQHAAASRRRRDLGAARPGRRPHLDRWPGPGSCSSPSYPADPAAVRGGGRHRLYLHAAVGLARGADPAAADAVRGLVVPAFDRHRAVGRRRPGNLIAELKSTLTDLQDTLEGLIRRAAGDRPIAGSATIDLRRSPARCRADPRLVRAGRPDRLVIGFGFAAMVCTFSRRAAVYFLVTGKSVAQGLFWMVPPGRRPLLAQIGARLDRCCGGFRRSLRYRDLIAVVAAYIGLGLILSIQHAFLLALFYPEFRKPFR